MPEQNAHILDDNTVTQEEIHVYLSLKVTVEDMKTSILEKLNLGGEVEAGVHKASLSTYDRSTMPVERFRNYIVFRSGQKALDSLIKRHSTSQEITKLNIR